MGMLMIPACSVAFCFGLVDLVAGDWFDAATSLGFAGFLLGMLLNIRRAHQPNTMYRLSLLFFGLLLFFWLFEGGDHGEKLLWLYIFPACALFALGYREGGIALSQC
jgi:cbb3-type cytochrome oxidase subunit 1